jgi:riboflavin synthase
MFTGIVERTGRVASLEDRPGRRVIGVSVQDEKGLPAWSPAVLGESIAVSGACLTVVAVRSISGGEMVSFDAVPETLEKTTLGRLRIGDLVNLERSLRAGDRFGGHYVTGHIDGVGTLRARRPEGDQQLFEVQAPPRLIEQIIPKGSIAVDGISLTVVDVDGREGWFSFAVIPHTLSWTNLASKGVGSAVNLETDAFGKWVLHAMGRLRGGAPSADDRLRSLLEESGHWGRSGDLASSEGGGGPGGRE